MLSQLRRVFLLAPFILSASHAAATDSHALCYRKVCGLVDDNGQPFFQRVFKGVSPFRADLAIIGNASDDKEKKGVINRHGEIVIPQNYYSLAISSSGRVLVHDRDDKGIIFDKTGQVVRKGKYYELGYSEGFDKKTEFDRESGRLRCEVQQFCDRPTGYRVTGGHYAIEDENGKRIESPGIRISYVQELRDRDESVEAEKVMPDGSKQQGQLFFDGSFMPAPPGYSLKTFRRGIAVAHKSGSGGEQIIDREGRFLSNDDSLEIFDTYAYDVMLVVKDNLRGLMNRRGKIVVPPQYLSLSPVTSNRFIVFYSSEQEGVFDAQGQGVIDEHGNWILRTTEESISFQGGLFILKPHNKSVTQGEKIYDIDGKQLAHPSLGYPFVFPEMGLIRYQDPVSEKNGLIDTNGNIVLPPAWDVIYFTQNPNLFITKSRSGNWSLVSRGGAVVITAGSSPISVEGQRVVIEDKLYDLSGHEITSYAKAFPNLIPLFSAEADFEKKVDPCFNPDVTKSLVLPKSLDTACRDKALIKRWRDANIVSYRVLDGSLDPLEIMQQNKAFNAKIRKCADVKCISTLLDARALELKKLDALASKPGPRIRSYRQPVEKAVRNALRPKLRGREGDRLSFSYVDLNADGRPEVLISEDTGANNYANWLFAQTDEGWRLILMDYSGYLRGIETMQHVSDGWPDLRVQSHGGAALHGINIHRYVDGAYQLRVTCDESFFTDDPMVVCKAAKARSARH